MAVSHVFSNTVTNWTGTVTVGNSNGNTQTIAATDLVRPQDWNSAHNQFYTLTGNTTGNTTASGTDVIFAGSGNITLVGSTDTLVFSGPVANCFSDANFGVNNNNQQTNTTASIRPFYLENNLAFGFARLLLSCSITSAANNSSAYLDISASMVIYSRNVSTLSSVTSLGITTTASWNSNNTASILGNVPLYLTCNNTTIPAGSYWAALHVSTANSATGGANTTALANSVFVHNGPNFGTGVRSFHPLGSGTNATLGIMQGGGYLATGATIATLAFSDYTQNSTSSALVGGAFFYLELNASTFQ